MLNETNRKSNYTVRAKNWMRSISDFRRGEEEEEETLFVNGIVTVGAV